MAAMAGALEAGAAAQTPAPPASTAIHGSAAANGTAAAVASGVATASNGGVASANGICGSTVANGNGSSAAANGGAGAAAAAGGDAMLRLVRPSEGAGQPAHVRGLAGLGGETGEDEDEEGDGAPGGPEAVRKLELDRPPAESLVNRLSVRVCASMALRNLCHNEQNHACLIQAGAVEVRGGRGGEGIGVWAMGSGDRG